MDGAGMTGASEKLAEAVARFCAERQFGTAFVVAGGASMHLIHAFADTPGCEYIPMHHEQAAAMAADGYARSTGGTGLAISTSGPGATNLVTGIAGAFYDSVPVLFITGQVSTTRMVGDTGVRQIGFQETPIVPMVSAITKSAVQVTSPSRIRYEMERAFWTLHHGRPGPVLIDIPDDLQREQVAWDELEGFAPPVEEPLRPSPSELSALSQLLQVSQRPVLVGGWGVHLSKAESAFRALVAKWKVPTVLTWGAADLLDGEHPLRVGTFGTHGTRHANLAIQNADLVVSVGSRLDTKATGSPVNSFARGARKVVVDVDPAELAKFSAFNLEVDLMIRADAGLFLEAASTLPRSARDFSPWMEIIRNWQVAFQAYDDAARQGEGVDPYRFMRDLGDSAPEMLDLFLDTGCTLPWLLQEFRPKPSQRIFHDFNNTAMGWALPALVGGMTASPERPAACIVGDGSLMMSVHELATLAGLRGAAKIILMDNSGYSMIRQTQDQWLGSDYSASSPEGGLTFPNFGQLAEAFGFEYDKVTRGAEASSKLNEFWRSQRNHLLHVSISTDARVIPQVKYGRPNEDMEPLLPRSSFLDAMIVEPLDVSRYEETT
jgi:acetolactate synthase-1/2/3 large subunit